MTPALIILAVLAGVGVVTGAIVLVGPALWRWSEQGAREQRATWERAAPSLGLAAVPPGNDTLAHLRGVRDGFDVSVALLPTAEPGTVDFVRVRILGRGRWPASVIVDPVDESLVPEDPNRVPPAPVLTGLGDFDEAILAYGPRHDVLATLDRAARDQLLATALRFAEADRYRVHAWLHAPSGRDVPSLRDGYSWRVENGTIEWHRRLTERRPAQVALVIDGLLALAHALDRGGRSTAQCLADNARDDVAPVRARHLFALADGFPQDPIRLEACRRALDDEDPATRLVAARALGRDHAATLAALLRGESVEEWIRVDALTAWEALPPAPEDAASLLEPLLATERPGLRVAAIRAAGRLGCAAVLSSLIALTRQARGDEARELAIALRLLGDPSAEDAVLHLLGAGAPAEVEALRALGALGSLASVEPLLPLATGLMVPRAVKRAARDALRAIRSRLGPADAGRLSLVEFDDAAGELSVAADADGRVSLEPRDEREGAR